MCDLTEFVSENSSFIITFSALVSSCIGGVLLCVLKSRCTRIQMGCLSCERSVISESELANITTKTSP